jgi:Bacterial PH domain
MRSRLSRIHGPKGTAWIGFKGRLNWSFWGPAAMSALPAAAPPRLLRPDYLANGEELRAETRATMLHYFPGPILALWLMLVLDEAAVAALVPWLPGLPGLTPFLRGISGGGSSSGAAFVLDVFLVLTLAALLLLGVRYFRWIRTVYAVTSSRIIIQRGVFSRDLEEIPISQVRGIEVHQSFLHRILGFGTLRVSSEGNSRVGNEDWIGIPQPFVFQRVIENASQNISRGQSPPITPPPRPS